MTSRTPQQPHSHTKPTTPFRRANKSRESWALSDFGRLSMTPRTAPVKHERPSPQLEGSNTSLASVPPSTWTSSAPSLAPPVFSFPEKPLRSPSISYTPPSPSDYTPESEYPGLTIRERQDSTASTSSISSTSSSSTTSSGYSSCTEYDDEFPDYETFRAKKGRDDRGVVQSARIVGEWLQ